MTAQLSSSRNLGLEIREHRLELPWVPAHLADTAPLAPGETFELYAREIYRPDMASAPALLYLQGGPGFPAPRPMSAEAGLIGEALKSYRVILMDQRGTGRSTRIDSVTAESQRTAAHLAVLRQEYIVADAEALRTHLGIERWSLFGQSFGGFCITSYLAAFPESIEHCFITGGLPALNAGADDIYRATYQLLAQRHQEFYRRYPWVDERIRQVCHHLDNYPEYLPTGERLSSRRLRTVGISLGRGTGFHQLAYLFEAPFHRIGGQLRLRTDFLHALSGLLSFGAAPLYAAIHESIYGGIGGQESTRWAADRIREEIPGFAEAADPTSTEPFYLTGEHIYPWQFEEDPALVPFAAAAQELAEYRFSSSPYAGTHTPGPIGAAAIYLDDIFVPVEFSRATAAALGDIRPYITNIFQHDGIGHDGAGIFARLRGLVAEY